MTFVSFFTRNGGYPALAERLRQSCERFGLAHRIMEIPDQGDWQRTLVFKPRMMLAALLETRGPVCWVDCDCEFLKCPDLLLDKGDHDFGIYNWRGDKSLGSPYGYAPATLLSSSGVVMFDYTAPAIELLLRWRETMADPDVKDSDDMVLDWVWKEYAPTVKPLWLPPQFNWMDKTFGKPPGDVVILHRYTEGGHREAA